MVRTIKHQANKPKTSQTRRSQDHQQQWQTLKDKAGELKSLPYKMSTSYQEDQAIEHPKFGLGFVRKVIDNNKIEIIFQHDIKVLAMSGDGSK
jgi:hypothetical protein